MVARADEGGTLSNRRDRLRVVWTIVGLLVVVGCLVLVGLARSGGLRIRSPLGAMVESVDRFALDADSTVVRTETAGERVCFVQCLEWRVDRDLKMVDRLDDIAACAQLREASQSWFGREPRVIEADDPLNYDLFVCSFWADELPDNDGWCASAMLLTPRQASLAEADIRISVHDDC